MGELLGIGLSHYPPLCSVDGDMAAPLRSTLRDPAIPSDRKDPANWPEPMQAEWRDEPSAAATHRAALVDGFTRCRAAIDEFAPDAVLVVGDDQYENFREDLIPPFAVLAYGDLIARPWADAQASSAMDGKPNTWGEAADFEFPVRIHRDIALTLVTGLLERGIDVAYAYRPLHHQSLSHAFMNTLLFLDYDRRGFRHPIVPFAVNCYGRSVISRRGFLARFGEEGNPDPPSPSPARMMEVGRTIADVVRANPWRVALVASSSWSHAFLCDKTWRLMPDIDADRHLYELMQAGDYQAIADLTLPELEEAGQQELLTWFLLFGAMERMARTPRWSTMVETYVFNSNKVFATF
jgi:Catalytic LigB subunit of aromatic ring-opening dioxygenase